MKKISRIIIIVILAIAVVGVLALKNRKTTKTANQTSAPEIAAQKPAVSSDGNNVAKTSSAPLPRLVDIGAGKCIPCRLMAPILEELKKDYQGSLEVVFVDVWENPNEAKKYGINVIPTQIFYDASGKELYRHEGFFSKEDILAGYKQLGIELKKTK